MVKFIFYIIKIIPFIFVFTFTFANELCVHPWRIGISERFPFEAFIDDKPGGLSVDIIQKTADKLKCKIDFFQMPFSRILYEAKTGKIDIILGIGKRKEREDFLHYFSPYLNRPSVIITLNNKIDYFNNFKIKDIKNKNFKLTIGAIIGTIYSKEYESLLNDEDFKSHIDFSTKNELNIKKLSAGRVDAIIVTDIIVANKLIKNQKDKGNFSIINLDKEDLSYFVYSKKIFSINQAKKIDNEIQRILRSKEIEKLMFKYLTNDEIKSMKIK